MKINDPKLLDQLWQNAIIALKIPLNDPNIKERRKLFNAGVCAMVIHMLDKPSKHSTKEMGMLMLDLQNYWDSENSCYDLLNLKIDNSDYRKDDQPKKHITVKPRTIRIPAGEIFCPCGTTVFVYDDREISTCPECDKDIRGLKIDEI